MDVPGQSQVSYAYDDADQLRIITQGTSVVSFAYDDAGRRTSHTLPNGIVTEYVYDAASRLTALTYRLGGNTLGTLTYDYNDAGDRVTVGGTWARTLQPAAVASATYNAANHQLTFAGQRLTSDLHGKRPRGATTVAGTSTTNSYGYTGRENDGTGLYYYRARYYHPGLQRFISQDPVGVQDGDNLYAYVGGNPLARVDPFGLSWEYSQSSGM